MASKEKLSATVDAELVRQAERAVREGAAPNVSAWINEAMRLKAAHDARLRALDAFLAAYEADHGQITDQDVSGAVRRARGRARVVREARGVAKPPARRRATGT